jgi:hypothetical protein
LLLLAGLRTLEYFNTQDKLDQAEKLMIQLHHTMAPWGYNVAMGGSRGKLGHLAKENIGNFHRGKTLSVETRSKIRQKLLGEKMCPAAKEKIRQTTQTKARTDILYVFDAVDHTLVFDDGVGRWDIVHSRSVPYHRMYDSLNNGTTFKLNGKRCYARKINLPHNDADIAQAGKKTEITFLEPANLDPMVFESMKSASQYLGLGRGVLQYYMKANMPCGKAIVNGQPTTISVNHIVVPRRSGDTHSLSRATSTATPT